MPSEAALVEGERDLPAAKAPTAGQAVHTYTIPGLHPGDPPILVTFRRDPAAVVRDMARDMLRSRQARGS